MGESESEAWPLLVSTLEVFLDYCSLSTMEPIGYLLCASHDRVGYHQQPLTASWPGSMTCVCVCTDFTRNEQSVETRYGTSIRSATIHRTCMYGVLVTEGPC